MNNGAAIQDDLLEKSLILCRDKIVNMFLKTLSLLSILTKPFYVELTSKEQNMNYEKIGIIKVAAATVFELEVNQPYSDYVFNFCYVVEYSWLYLFVTKHSSVLYNTMR